ncbi:hypothetical protein MMSR116_06630 [Methylobacterium mesophilicum SR1.6/6]|uniref:Uncharacterized protein n=1 Tax=Methylobacterium mesophilicum SR1.6/6 TaxID=908290 RepID=A0A6B9FL15_9HYPH|nr:hypothetical protein [Methylobacterium mesophilicum]QGY01608.1 hypothetical protein MMSR116_06630 [Methylobacterium mesophilicum SR1.6/6]
MIPGAARFYAEALGQRSTGVAIPVRTIGGKADEAGDRLVATGGAVPAFTPGAMQWTTRLN